MRSQLFIAQAQAWAIYGTEDAVHECRKANYRVLHLPPGPLQTGGAAEGSSTQGAVRQPLPNWEERHKKLRDALENETIKARSVDPKGHEYDVPGSAWARHGMRMGGSGGALIPSDQLMRVLPKRRGGAAAYQHDPGLFRTWFEEMVAASPSITENQLAQDLQDRCDAEFGKAPANKKGVVKSRVSVSTFKRMINKTWAKGPLSEIAETWFNQKTRRS